MTCSAGVVNDPRTWSGTPHALFEAMNDTALIDVVPAAPPTGRLLKKLARKADRRLQQNHPSIDGPLSRRVQWQNVHAQARSAACTATLHLGTYDLPARPQSGMPAYLYIDTTYDLWRRQSSRRGEISARQQRIFWQLEQRAVKATKHIFAIGQHVANNLISAYGLAESKITVVGTGRGNIAPYAAPKDVQHGRMLTVAKVRPHDQGIPLLLDAFAHARRQNPRLTLTVVGGQKIPGIAQMEGVEATGWLTEEQLQSLFENASLFVMPAHYEPWGLVYLEALSCQVPIMGLPRNAFPELSAHGDHGFAARSNTNELAQDILDALADSKRLAEMGRKGFAFASRFDWAHTGRAIATTIALDQNA